MKRFLIAATLPALIAACALERTDPADPPESSDGDPLPAATTSMDELASTSRITPHLCAMPWSGAGPYYVCTATGGPWWHDRNACTASCGGFCELIARCSAPCNCTPN
jgi:hypothetical protein